MAGIDQKAARRAAMGAQRAQAAKAAKPAQAKAAPSKAGRDGPVVKGNDETIKNKKASKGFSLKDLGKKGVLLEKVGKIRRLPKDVRSTLPFKEFVAEGVLETDDGVYTKSYKLHDVNFSIAPAEDQRAIFKNFMDIVNYFDENTKFQFTIFNHEVDKREIIDNIRISPQRDGLNRYRQELNTMLLKNLKEGNNSIRQEKYLTVALEDDNQDHALIALRNLDSEISKKLRRICKVDTLPMTSAERMETLHDIYNQDFEYRMATGTEGGKDVFDPAYIERCGMDLKDVIGPPSIDFSGASSFMLGNMYAAAMYLEKVPAFLSTTFISELADLQCNMLISTTCEAINQEKAIRLVKNQLATIESRVAAIQKKNGEEGYFGALPPDLEHSQQSARELMKDLTSRNQNLFYVTVTIVVFARTKEQLEENVKLVKNNAGKNLVPIKTIRFQQEFCFNTALPLCRNDVFVERLYTTESASVFIPFNAQEIIQKNAIFYGLNQTTKSMVLYDRFTGNNYNGLIFGYSGSGKSFTAKQEMTSVLLNKPNAQVFVVDPQGEYYPLAGALHGQEVQLSPGNKVYINPLDLDISEDDENENDPITMKSDFVLSMFDIIIGKGRELDPIHTSLLDKCVRKIYRPYIEELKRTGKTCDLRKCPTLSDLYQELIMLKNERYEAGHLADILYQYAIGSFDTFAHRTNVDTDARFVVYNTKALGSGMKELGLHICTNDIWNRMIRNSKKEVQTWFYIDEFHVLLESNATTVFLKRVWKLARKWQGVPTGIMQNTEDLLRTADTRAIVNNTSFVIMLKEPLMDRQNLAELFNLSPAQLEYITNSDPGHGLLYNGKITVPFGHDFPKNTELYKALTTAHDVEGSTFR